MIACLVNSRGFCVPKVEITGGERVVEMICAYISIRPRPLQAGNSLTSGQLPFTSNRESVLPGQSLALARTG
jgi:hypothetical protein